MNKPHPHRELIHKWAEGSEIQVMRRGGWIDVPFPSWFEKEEYRIKPDRVKRTGWVNICWMRCEANDSYTNYVGGTIFSSLESALMSKPSNWVAAVKVEWEE